MRVTSEYTKMPINQYQRRIVTLDDLISKMRAEKERIAGQIAQAKAAGTAAEEALAGELSERSRGAKTRELENAVKALAHTKQRLQVLEAKLVKAVSEKRGTAMWLTSTSASSAPWWSSLSRPTRRSLVGLVNRSSRAWGHRGPRSPWAHERCRSTGVKKMWRTT